MLKKKLLLLIVLFFSINSFSQNIYSVVRVARGTKPIKIARTTIALPGCSDMAYRAMAAQTKRIEVVYFPDRVILQSLIKQEQTNPLQISGGYNYLRTISQSMRNETFWKHINASQGYNGVHHIITKSTLKWLYKNRRRTDNGLTFEDFVRNSPAAFHPLHNESEFGAVFHNPVRQLSLYQREGIKGILQDYFNRANELSRTQGMIEYDETFIERTFQEAIFWASMWGLEWGEPSRLPLPDMN